MNPLPTLGNYDHPLVNPSLLPNTFCVGYCLVDLDQKDPYDANVDYGCVRMLHSTNPYWPDAYEMGKEKIVYSVLYFWPLYNQFIPPPSFGKAHTIPGPNSCTIPAGLVVVCNGTSPTVYLSTLIGPSVYMRQFSQDGYLLAGNPAPTLIVPSTWCTASTVIHCPISDTPIPGVPVANFTEYPTTGGGQALFMYQIQSIRDGDMYCMTWKNEYTGDETFFSWSDCTGAYSVFYSNLISDNVPPSNPVMRVTIIPFASDGTYLAAFGQSAVVRNYTLRNPTNEAGDEWGPSLSVSQFTFQIIDGSQGYFSISSPSIPGYCLSSINAERTAVTPPPIFVLCNSSDIYQFFQTKAVLTSSYQISGGSDGYTFNDPSILSKIGTVLMMSQGDVGFLANPDIDTPSITFPSQLSTGEIVTVAVQLDSQGPIPTFPAGIPEPLELFKRSFLTMLQLQFLNSSSQLPNTQIKFEMSTTITGSSLAMTLSMTISVTSIQSKVSPTSYDCKLQTETDMLLRYAVIVGFSVAVVGFSGGSGAPMVIAFLGSTAITAGSSWAANQCFS